MTRSDKWKKRPVVMSYFAWRNEFVMKCNLAGWRLGPKLRADFFIAMPDTWSKKKRDAMRGQLHQQKPDLDNIVKSVQDAFGVDDGFVAMHETAKYWADKGCIHLY